MYIFILLYIYICQVEPSESRGNLSEKIGRL
jgi:hypothetical protein